MREALDAYSREVPEAPDFARMTQIHQLPSPIASALSPLVYLYKSGSLRVRAGSESGGAVLRLGERRVAPAAIGRE